MDVATTLGSLLLGVGAVVGGVVAFLGKRGENALAGYSSLTKDLQGDRAELKAERAELAAQRATDQAEIARLTALVIRLGGEP